MNTARTLHAGTPVTLHSAAYGTTVEGTLHLSAEEASVREGYGTHTLILENGKRYRSEGTLRLNA